MSLGSRLRLIWCAARGHHEWGDWKQSGDVAWTECKDCHWTSLWPSTVWNTVNMKFTFGAMSDEERRSLADVFRGVNRLGKPQ